MPSRSLKGAVRAFLGPVGRAVGAIGISANVVTIAGLALAAGSGVLLARGFWRTAFVCLLGSGLCDLLDGAVARARGGAGSRLGAALDSTVDRYGEALVLTGILVHRVQHGAGAPFMWLWALALTASFLISYVRARAEGLGLRCEVGLLERPERMGLLLVLCLLGPRAAPWILGVLALGGHITFVQRLILVHRAGNRREGGTM